MKLVQALIHWISEFPASVIQADCTIVEFLSIPMIYKLFRYLFNQDFNISICDDEIEEIFKMPIITTVYSISDHSNLLGLHNVIGQIHILEMILVNHFKNSLLKDFKPELNLYKLILFHDGEEVEKYCELLVEICTKTSKLSTVGLTTLEFLTDEDKIMLEDIIYKRRQLPNNNYQVNSETEDYEVIPRQQTTESSSTNSSNYINSDELRLLRWENKLFQSVIYQLGMSRKPN
ncbi:hypothetical protein JA1_000236 [Spathaspora sp. JA1]|nr:hypothetical protein JA1_000236 [Spathaspora sp. JA1]